jgi:hypothetical protein
MDATSLDCFYVRSSQEGFLSEPDAVLSHIAAQLPDLQSTFSELILTELHSARHEALNYEYNNPSFPAESDQASAKCQLRLLNCELFEKDGFLESARFELNLGTLFRLINSIKHIDCVDNELRVVYNNDATDPEPDRPSNMEIDFPSFNDISSPSESGGSTSASHSLSNNNLYNLQSFKNLFIEFIKQIELNFNGYEFDYDVPNSRGLANLIKYLDIQQDKQWQHMFNVVMHKIESKTKDMTPMQLHIFKKYIMQELERIFVFPDHFERKLYSGGIVTDIMECFLLSVPRKKIIEKIIRPHKAITNRQTYTERRSRKYFEKIKSDLDSFKKFIRKNEFVKSPSFKTMFFYMNTLHYFAFKHGFGNFKTFRIHLFKKFSSIRIVGNYISQKRKIFCTYNKLLRIREEFYSIVNSFRQDKLTTKNLYSFDYKRSCSRSFEIRFYISLESKIKPVNYYISNGLLPLPFIGSKIKLDIDQMFFKTYNSLLECIEIGR